MLETSRMKDAPVARQTHAAPRRLSSCASWNDIAQTWNRKQIVEELASRDLMAGKTKASKNELAQLLFDAARIASAPGSDRSTAGNGTARSENTTSVSTLHLASVGDSNTISGFSVSRDSGTRSAGAQILGEQAQLTEAGEHEDSESIPSRSEVADALRELEMMTGAALELGDLGRWQEAARYAELATDRAETLVAWAAIQDSNQSISAQNAPGAAVQLSRELDQLPERVETALRRLEPLTR